MLTKIIGNRKKTFIIGCLLAAIIAVTAGVIVYMNSDTAKIRKHLDMGNRYLADLQYEQAVVEFTKAFDLDPDNPVVVGNLVSAYLSWSDALTAEGDFEKAIEILTQGYEATGDESLGAKLATIRDKYRYEILYNVSTDIKKELAEIGNGGIPPAGKYRTFDEKKEIFMPVINDLNDYIETLEQNPDLALEEKFPNDDTDAYCNGITTDSDVYLPDMLTPGYVYAALSVCYLHIGEMDNCLNAREKLAKCIGDESILSNHFDSSGNIEYDKYGRQLRNISGGFSDKYSDESANNSIRTETTVDSSEYEYENGRLIAETNIYVVSSNHYTYSYQGDTVSFTCYSVVGDDMEYETTGSFQIDKFGNRAQENEAWQ